MYAILMHNGRVAKKCFLFITRLTVMIENILLQWTHHLFFFLKLFTIGDFHLGIHAKVVELIGNFLYNMQNQFNKFGAIPHWFYLLVFRCLRPHWTIKGLEISLRQNKINCFPLERPFVCRMMPLIICFGLTIG